MAEKYDTRRFSADEGNLCFRIVYMIYMLLTKTAAAQNEVALSYHTVRGLYFLAAVFAAIVIDWVASIEAGLITGIQ